MEKRKFGICDIMNAKSRAGAAVSTDEYTEIYLDPRKVKPSESNFYSQENIEELADSFLAVGQQQPTVLGRVNGEFRIVSGHRRNLANILNIERGYGKYCRVRYLYRDMTEAMFELSLLIGNVYNRELTAWEKTEQAGRLKKALIKAKEEDGMELPGKLRDIIAKLMNESGTNIARMENINNNATPEIKKEFAKGNLGISAAYEAAKLSPEEQRAIADEAAGGKDIRAKEIAAKVAEKSEGKKEDNPHVPEEDIPGQMHIEDYPELMPEPCAASHIKDSGCDYECSSSMTQTTEPESAADVEYREMDGDSSKMLTFAVEAFLEQIDIDAWIPHIRDSEGLHKQIKDDFLFSNAIDFKFRTRKLRMQFLEDIRLMSLDTGKELERYSWEQFFCELDRIGAVGEKYAEEVQVKDAERSGELPEPSDIELLQNKLEKEKKNLAVLKEDYTDRDKRVRLQELVVGALAANICDLENIRNQPPEPVQPELPPLKNNDQRKEWLKDYKAWGLWYEDKNIGCRYYKYDFENGARLIAETYLVPKSKYFAEHETCYLHLVGGPEPPKDKTGCYGKWQRNEEYNKFPTSETELVEFLKFMQRK